jgi:N-dimethylarginine dimethylaminohydrolase
METPDQIPCPAANLAARPVTEQDVPAFLMNVPFSLSTDQPNNAWMLGMEEGERRVDLPTALRQFRELYAFLAGRAIVYLLPSRDGLQDQTYVANLGVVLPHLAEPTVVVSNFRSEPRRGEREVGIAFFEDLGVPLELAPPYFEGEADLKHLSGDVYVGACGLRTSRGALRWFERRFDMNLIRFPMRNEYLYHLDCSIFRITRDDALVCTAAADAAALRAIERHVGVIDVSLDDAESGITNCVRIGDCVLCASNIDALDAGDDDYPYERSKVKTLEEICAKRKLTPVFFDLSEFMKSGAMLSCMIMHLNHANF